MNKEFNTTKMRVWIEYLSATGSSFGSNEDGNTVFFNKRLVDRVGLTVGDVVDADVIPNFEDKRETIPWRAVRVSLHQQKNVGIPSVGKIEQEIYTLLANEDQEYWTVEELGEAAGQKIDVVCNSCGILFAQGLIAKAEVHAQPSQDRALFCLWALNADCFR
jgi:hypothetical protein